MDEGNHFKRYVGYAAQTSYGDSLELEVIIPELLPMYQGPVIPCPSPELLVAVNNVAKGGKNLASLKSSNTIKCEYMCKDGSVSVPNIHTGEQVDVYNFAGVDKYYWLSSERDSSSRTVEHKKFRISNKPSTLLPLTDETSYSVEMDSRPGKRGVRLRTSHGTFEEFSYDINVDTDNGTVTVVDNTGTGFELTSAWPKDADIGEAARRVMDKAGEEMVKIFRAGNVIDPLDIEDPVKVSRQIKPEIRIKNSWGSFAELVGDICNIYTENEINAVAKNKCSLEAPDIMLKGNTTVMGSFNSVGPTTLQSSLTVNGLSTFVGGTVGDRV